MAHFITSDHTPIHFEETGEGPTVVLIHGWGMSGGTWGPIMRRLASRYRLLAVDLRGHGRSGTAGDYTLPRLCADLVELFDQNDLSDAVLAGWSLGGQVALAAVPDLETRLAGLVLVATTPRFTTAEDFPHALPSSEVQGMQLRLRRRYLDTMRTFTRNMFTEEEWPAVCRLAADLIPEEKFPSPAVAQAALQVLESTDLRPLLSRVNPPAHLVHGTSDRICPPGASAYLAERLPAASVQLMDEAGHAPFISRPDEFAAIVAAFCGRVHARN